MNKLFITFKKVIQIVLTQVSIKTAHIMVFILTCVLIHLRKGIYKYQLRKFIQP